MVVGLTAGERGLGTPAAAQVESLFILWRITRNPLYREWGWEIWKAFERSSTVASGGYTSIKNVLQDQPPYATRDRQVCTLPSSLEGRHSQVSSDIVHSKSHESE